MGDVVVRGGNRGRETLLALGMLSQLYAEFLEGDGREIKVAAA